MVNSVPTASDGVPGDFESLEVVGPSGASSPRLIVLEVTEINFDEKHLRVLETRVNAELRIELHGDWARTELAPSHIIRVVLICKDGKFQPWRTRDHLSYSPTNSTTSIPSIILVDNSQNLIIVHPDTLVSGTTVSDSFRCIRKSVVNARVPPALDGTSLVGEAALFGSMIHDLFQNVLVLDSNTRDYSTCDELSQVGGTDIMSFFEAVEDVLNRHSDSLFAASIPLPHARKVLHKVVPQLAKWYTDVMGNGNFQNTQGVLVQSSGKSLANVIVTKVHDIEELVWCPSLGLKGKIDASVHLRVNGEDCGIAVLELKSGKAVGYSSVSHSAQVSLYNLLLSDRKGAPVTHGFLTYIRYQKALQSVREDEQQQKQLTFSSSSSSTQHYGNDNGAGRVKLGESIGKFEDDLSHRLVSTQRAELVALIMQRNSIAIHLRSDVDIEDLPPLLVGQRDVCERCFAVDSCLVQHRLLENGREDSDIVRDGPGRDLFRMKTGHLTNAHAEYYSFWRTVLADEEEHALRGARTVWSLPGVQKEESIGKCVADLQLIVDNSEDKDVNGDEEFGGNVSSSSPHALLAPGTRATARFRRRRRRQENLQQLPYDKSLQECGLSVGDFVVVSAEQKHNNNNNNNNECSKKSKTQFELEGCATWQSALTNGFIKTVTSDYISVSVDRSLAAWTTHQNVNVDDVTWRIDAEETAVSHNVAKRTLETLFFCDEARPGVRRRRELIVDGVVPVFSAEGNDMDRKIKITMNNGNVNDDEKKKKERIKAKQMMDKLNEEQRRAVDLSFRAKDYLLILGMPGTGKTATLAAIIVAHARAGKNVLVCSHTNTAVDNMLLRLLSCGYDDFMRLGRNLEVIDESIHPYHVSKIVEYATNWKQVENEVCGRRVVATTCLGIGHWVLQRRKLFDLVVVDEASQMMQPICIGPLLYANGAFVLVGDHYQLPPLQRSGIGIGRRLTRMDAKEERTGTHGDEIVKQASEESLFRRLCVRHPEAMVLLSRQYRMANDIMQLCNELVYSGSMRCGNRKVGEQYLETSWRNDSVTSSKSQSKERWLEWVRNGDRKVIFLDCNGEGEVENIKEARIVRKCVHQLIKDGVKASDITVLSPFRAQVDLMRDALKRHAVTKECQSSTVDQYQGKDNECVIVSLVRNGNGRSGAGESVGGVGVGHLLRDWRRINVAMTRAKRKLIFVGSAEAMMQGSSFLRRLVLYLRSPKLNAVIDCN